MLEGECIDGQVNQRAIVYVGYYITMDSAGLALVKFIIQILVSFFYEIIWTISMNHIYFLL